VEIDCDLSPLAPSTKCEESSTAAENYIKSKVPELSGLFYLPKNDYATDDVSACKAMEHGIGHNQRGGQPRFRAVVKTPARSSGS